MPWPVMMITSTSGKSSRIARINSWPRRPGIARSSVTTSIGRGVEDLERFGAARDQRHVVGRRENHAERFAGAALVVDDEHAWRGRGCDRSHGSPRRASQSRIACVATVSANCRVAGTDRFKSLE